MGEAAAAFAPADPVRRHGFSRSDYYRMAEVGILAPDARVELIEGEIVDMPPIGSRHAAVVDILVERLRDALRARAHVRSQSPIVLGEDAEPQPDIAVLRRKADFYRSAHPRPGDVLLLVEVADTTLRFDREVKVPLYARADIPEVWVVDIPGRMLHIHAAPSGDAYSRVRRVEPPATLAPAALPQAAIDLGALFGD